MIQNKNGPPGWLHPPNKGAPRGPSPGTGGQQMNVMTGYFSRNGRATFITETQRAQRFKRKERRNFTWRTLRLLSDLCGKN